MVPCPAGRGVGLGFLIHDKETAKEEQRSLAGVVCQPGLGGNQKHAHQPGCKLYDPNDPTTWSARLRARAEAAAKVLNKETPEETVLKKADPKLFVDTAVHTPLERDSEVAEKRNLNQRQRKKKQEAKYTEVSLTTAGGHSVTIMTKADLQNDIVEDPSSLMR